MLVATGCVDTHPAMLSTAERAAAAMLYTLLVHEALPARLAPWVWQRLTASRQADTPTPVLLCLDVWDEVRSGRQELAEALQAFAKVTAARIVLTSRILGYDQRPLPVDKQDNGPHREQQICPFAWEETETFRSAFLSRRPGTWATDARELRDKIAVAGMAQNPLLATLLCLAFSPNPQRQPLSFPLRRVEVYKRVLHGLLGEWDKQDAKAPRHAQRADPGQGAVVRRTCLSFFPR